MGEEIFRKKSLDKVKSPENLDDYIRVSNPGVWLLLISVIILLAGACVWGILGSIDSTVPAVVRVEDGEAVCYVAEENIFDIAENMTVKFGGTQGVIDSIGSKEDSGYVCILKTEGEIKDGFYDGKVVTKSYKPLSFILN